jgi:hypothetical protein
MLTRRKILKLLMKSIFKDGWRSWETFGGNSGILSRESLSFDDGDKYYTIQVTTQKIDKGE